MSLDLIPMLLLSLLLMTASGDVGTVELVLGGAHDATAQRGGLIVGDGQVTVPAGARLPGPVHVLGGQTRIRGTVDGDVAHIAGRLVVEDGARIAGTLQHLGGALEVAPGATITRQTSVDLAPGKARPGRAHPPQPAAHRPAGPDRRPPRPPPAAHARPSARRSSPTP